jgi:hypothetical protein
MATPATATKDTLGQWFCPPGDYSDLVQDLCTADPRLKERDAELIECHIPWKDRPHRIVKYEIKDNGTLLEDTEYSDLKDLDNYLDSRDLQGGNGRTCFIVEHISPSLVQILGSRFGIHPSVFVNHERATSSYNLFFHKWGQQSDMPMLPSAVRANSSFTLTYREVLHTFPPPGSPYIRCADSGRFASVTRRLGGLSPNVVMRRKCTFWSRRVGGKGWICESA